MHVLADTLGMEGNVIERRTSMAQLWSDARQHTLPSTSTSTPVAAVPAYSNIFVTPPGTDVEHRSHLVKGKDVDNAESGASKLSQIKDKHDGEAQNFCFCKDCIYYTKQNLLFQFFLSSFIQW